MPPILLDCDTGIDDALAILYLACSGQAEIVAAGSVHGNVPSPLAALNTRRVFELVGLNHVPVAVGAQRPMAQPLTTAEFVHGKDGLGNTNQPAPKQGPVAGSAVEQIVRLARQRPGELTLVATGPLTNLGAALLVEPELPSLLHRVVVMGGAVAVPGNVTALAEANIWHDPEAAELVFNAGWTVTMIGLDVTMRVRLEGDSLRRIETAKEAVPRFVWSILQQYLSVYETSLGYRACPLHDPLAAVLALRADLATYQHSPIHVELQGGRTRGMTVVDRRPKHAAQQQERPRVAIAMDVEIDAVREEFLAAILGL